MHIVLLNREGTWGQRGLPNCFPHSERRTLVSTETLARKPIVNIVWQLYVFLGSSATTVLRNATSPELWDMPWVLTEFCFKLDLHHG